MCDISEINVYSVCISLLPQNGRLGDADIERLKLTDPYINGTQVCHMCNKFFRIHAVKRWWFYRIGVCAVCLPQYRMVDPAHGALEESYTPEDESQEVHSVFSEEGTSRRPDNGVSDPWRLWADA